MGNRADAYGYKGKFGVFFSLQIVRAASAGMIDEGTDRRQLGVHRFGAVRPPGRARTSGSRPFPFQAAIGGSNRASNTRHSADNPLSRTLPVIEGIDAIVYCAGALQDGPHDSLRAVHSEGPSSLYSACALGSV